MQTETEKLERRVILVVGVVGGHCNFAQSEGIRATIEHSNTFNDFIFEVIEKDVEEMMQRMFEASKDVEEMMQRMFEASKGIDIMIKNHIQLPCVKPVVVEKNLPTYKQDKSKKYFKRFLK